MFVCMFRNNVTLLPLSHLARAKALLLPHLKKGGQTAPPLLHCVAHVARPLSGGDISVCQWYLSTGPRQQHYSSARRMCSRCNKSYSKVHVMECYEVLLSFADTEVINSSIYHIIHQFVMVRGSYFIHTPWPKIIVYDHFLQFQNNY